MKREADRIDSVIKSIIGKLDKKKNLTSDEVENIWKEIVGEKASAHTRPASLRKKQLVINIDGSSWLYELTLRKNELLAKLKKRMGEDKIKELRFRIGEI